MLDPFFVQKVNVLFKSVHFLVSHFKQTPTLSDAIHIQKQMFLYEFPDHDIGIQILRIQEIADKSLIEEYEL